MSPITELGRWSFLLLAKDINGTIMIPIPADDGIWREPIDHISRELVAQYPNSHIEFWVAGKVSTLARLRLRERGMEVKEHVGSIIPFMD